MQSATAVLESRSKAQALDWSLVLISQAIESVISQREEDGAWVLEVAESDWRRATEAIAAYERENATMWRQEVKWTGLLFDIRSVFWFAALSMFHVITMASRTDFQTAGLMNRTALQQGDWWRLFTAVTLHADIAHLAANVTTGIVFLGLAMGCFGWGNALLLSFLGGAIGNVGTFFVHNYSLGASGMVMASLGLLTAHSLSLAKHEKRTVWIGRGVIAGCLLVVLLGFNPKSDVVAHVGGFIGGVVLGIVAARFQSVLRRPGLNASASLLCAAIVLLTWWLALR